MLRYMYGLDPEEKQEGETDFIDQGLSLRIFRVASEYKVQGLLEYAASNIKDWLKTEWQSVHLTAVVKDIYTMPANGGILRSIAKDALRAHWWEFKTNGVVHRLVLGGGVLAADINRINWDPPGEESGE